MAKQSKLGPVWLVYATEADPGIPRTHQRGIASLTQCGMTTQTRQAVDHKLRFCVLNRKSLSFKSESTPSDHEQKLQIAWRTTRLP